MLCCLYEILLLYPHCSGLGPIQPHDSPGDTASAQQTQDRAEATAMILRERGTGLWLLVALVFLCPRGWNFHLRFTGCGGQMGTDSFLKTVHTFKSAGSRAFGTCLDVLFILCSAVK